MYPLLQHGLDEDMELIAALVLCSMDPLVIPIAVLAVLQAGQYYFLGLVDIIQVPGSASLSVYLSLYLYLNLNLNLSAPRFIALQPTGSF